MSLTHEYNLTETDIVNRLGRSATFGKEETFEIKAVYRNKSGSEWKLCSALIHRVEEEQPEFRQIYKEDAFFSVYKKYSSVSEILNLMFDEGISITDGLPSITINEKRHWEENLIPSVLSPTKSPLRHYLYSIDSCNYSDGPLVGFLLPYYPSFNERLKEFIEYEKRDGNRIHFLVEDKRALLELKDEQVTLKSKYNVHLSGQLETREGIEKIDKHISKECNISLSDLISVELWAVGKNNLVLDYISSTGHAYRYELPKQEYTLEEYLKEKIKNGETIDCEFKKFIELKKGDTKADEIDKTVCAFSNTNGGDLIIGVTDEREVIGIGPEVRKKYFAPLKEAISEYAKNIRKRLYENLTLNTCFEVYDIELYGKNLIVISVVKTESWNLMQSSHIPFARIGSTNYNATNLVALELENKNRNNHMIFE